MDDAWRPTAPLAHLRRRAQVMAQIRSFFARRGVVEVDLPLLGAAPVTDPQIEAFPVAGVSVPAVAKDGGDSGEGTMPENRTHGISAPGAGVRYLQTSPEYAMKRLLAAGSGPIYQLGKVFRVGESGPRHNPEFTLLEWYRPGVALTQLGEEVADLVAQVLGSRPRRWCSYRELLLEHTGLDLHRASTDALAACAREQMELSFQQADRDTWLNLLFATLIEPRLGRGEMTLVSDFPASQAALARLHKDATGTAVAARFEVFVEGMELANGYHELADAAEQGARFEADLQRRRAAGRPQPPVDRRLLAALAAGLPDCCGVALGVDRLLMLAMGAQRIDEVMAFPWERA